MFGNDKKKISAFFASTSASRVIELSDRFLDIHKEGQWLVMASLTIKKKNDKIYLF